MRRSTSFLVVGLVTAMLTGPIFATAGASASASQPQNTTFGPPEPPGWSSAQTIDPGTGSAVTIACASCDILRRDRRRRRRRALDRIHLVGAHDRRHSPWRIARFIRRLVPVFFFLHARRQHRGRGQVERQLVEQPDEVHDRCCPARSVLP